MQDRVERATQPPRGPQALTGAARPKERDQRARLRASAGVQTLRREWPIERIERGAPGENRRGNGKGSKLWAIERSQWVCRSSRGKRYWTCSGACGRSGSLRTPSMTCWARTSSRVPRTSMLARRPWRWEPSPPCGRMTISPAPTADTAIAMPMAILLRGRLRKNRST